MTGVLLALCVLLSAICPRTWADDSPPLRDLRVTDAVGQATIRPAENSKIALPLSEDTPLQEGDVIETGPKGTAEITMDAETVFSLEPGSKFTVLKMFEKNTQFELSQGGMLGKVKPVAQGEQALIIKLPTAVVAIRGTEFAAETADGITHVGLFDEGHVVVAGAWGREHILLGPNQETHVTLSNVPRPPTKLAYFVKRRPQMAQVRLRTIFWKKYWRPMGPVQRQTIRQRLGTPHAILKQGFQHPAARSMKLMHRAPPKRHRVVHHKKPMHHTHHSTAPRKRVKHKSRRPPVDQAKR